MPIDWTTERRRGVRGGLLAAALALALSGCQEYIADVNACEGRYFPAFYLAASGLHDENFNEVMWQRGACAYRRIRTVEQGYALQRQFVALRQEYARVAGYKIALTHADAQRGYGFAGPVIGVLFDDMLLSDNTVISTRVGRRLGYEADLLVRIADDGITDATSLLELLPHLESVIAFMELPDLLVPQRVLSSGRFLAVNTGARLGVLGSETEVSDDPEFLTRLSAMSVVVKDGKDRVLHHAAGAPGGRNPLESLLTLVEQLRQRGETLKTGEIVSLGSYTPPQLIGDITKINITYQGLGDLPIAVSARFY